MPACDRCHRSPAEWWPEIDPLNPPLLCLWCAEHELTTPAADLLNEAHKLTEKEDNRV